MQLKGLIIRETGNWIALNKPAGLLSIPDREGKEPSLKDLLKEIYGEIFTVHRIDRDTSGLIIFAKNEAAHKHLSGQFEHRETVKIYQGIVIGAPFQEEGRIESPLMEHPVKKGMMVVNRKGKEAITDYKLLESFKSYSLLEFRIHTGRTHQIRVHMKDLGCPIAADELYGDGKPVLLSAIKQRFKLSKNEEEEKPILGRLGLHSYLLQFTDLNGEKIQLEAELPKDMRALLQQLHKWKK